MLESTTLSTQDAPPVPSNSNNRARFASDRADFDQTNKFQNKTEETTFQLDQTHISQNKTEETTFQLDQTHISQNKTEETTFQLDQTHISQNKTQERTFQLAQTVIMKGGRASGHLNDSAGQTVILDDTEASSIFDPTSAVQDMYFYEEEDDGNHGDGHGVSYRS
jgi:hypothetical protein